MTPDQRQAIIAQITTLMNSGKHPAEIVTILHGAGLPLAEVKQLVFEASAQVAPVYLSHQPPEEEPIPLVRPLTKVLVACISLAIFGGGWQFFQASKTPEPAQQEGPPQPEAQSATPAAIPVSAPALAPQTLWAPDKTTQVRQAGRNTYDYHAGFFPYGIIRHECDPVAADSSGVSSDLNLMRRAQVVAQAEFINAYNNNQLRIVTAAGEQKPVSLQFICILLVNAQRGGVYCGALIPAGGFFNVHSNAFDEKRFEYQNLVAEAGPEGAKRYPIIDRHDALYTRRTEAIRQKISMEEARAIAHPMITDWLAQNGYDQQSETFIRRSEKMDPYGYLFTVEGDTMALKDEGTVTLFTVQVDGKSGKPDLRLRADCAEFLRLLRERGVVPKK